MQLEPNYLCSSCLHIIAILTLPPERISEEHVRRSYLELTFAEVELSAAEGCHLCSIVMANIFDSASRNPKPRIFKETVVRVMVSDSPSNMERRNLLRVSTGTDPIIFEGDVKGQLAHRNSLQQEPRMPLESSTEGDDAFELAVNWLTSCLRSHVECSSDFSHSIGEMPSRLIHIGAAREMGGVRLCIISELPRPVRYLILSHCWGHAKFMTLTKENLSSFQDHIPYERLSKTFQDALVICQRLGFDYLWIDSLCIIQDSQEDWEIEASRMGDYYLNAVCAIAALGAADGTEGCFMSRNPLFRRPLEIPCSEPDHVMRLEPSEGVRHEFLEEGRQASPLHKRAWVVQERLLAPRTLYYGRWGICWECREQIATECDPDSDHQSEGATLGHRLKLILTYFPETLESEADILDFRQSWAAIVETYTYCDLTFRKDKLVALAGIMKTIQRKLHLTFRAGLCREFMILDLLWKRKDTGKGDGQRFDDVAPTWSWASLDGPIQLFTQPSHSRTLVHSVKVDILQPREVKPPAYAMKDMKIKIELWTPMINVKVGTEDLSMVGRLPFLKMHEDHLTHFKADVPVEEDLEVWAVPLVQYRGNNGREQIDDFCGLVLNKLEGEQNAWVRVGQFQTHSWPTDELGASSNQHLRGILIYLH